MNAAPLALFRMAARNVRKHWRHSLGSVLSIAVGFVAIGLFSGYLDDLTARQARELSQRSMLGDVLIERTGASGRAGREDFWGHQLGEREQAFIDGFLSREAGRVKQRARFLELTGLASAGKAGLVFLGFGHDVAEGAELRGEHADNASVGAPLRAGVEAQVLLAQGLGGALDCGGEKGALKCRRPRVQLTSTTEEGRLNVVEPEVVGLFNAGLKELDGRMLMLPLPLAQRLADTKQVTRYAVQLAPGEDAADFAARLEREAKAQGLELTATRWQDHQMGELYRRGLELLGLFRSFVVVIVVAIAAMSVLMTMMRAVSERTREVGMLRSLGFLRRHVIGLFVLEAWLLAVASSLVGALATAVLIAACNRSGVTYKAGILADAIPLAVAVVPRAWLFAVGFLSSVAVLAAFVPARRAASLSIPDALGHV